MTSPASHHGSAGQSRGETEVRQATRVDEPRTTTVSAGAGAIPGGRPVPPGPAFEGRYARFPPLDKPAVNLGERQEADREIDRLSDSLYELAKSMELPAGVPLADLENRHVPAGYTYLGQFIAHDLTFDPISRLSKLSDPSALIDYRTPRFDLDCVYGRGPEDQPYLYDLEGEAFAVGANDFGEQDLPRDNFGRALVADTRNDDNLILSQLHLAMLLAHNQRVREVREWHPSAFTEAADLLRNRYQWIVLHDFLRRIVDEQVYARFVHDKADNVLFVKHQDGGQFSPGDHPYIPIEFAAAGFRIGHSMVRPEYSLNEATVTSKVRIFSSDAREEDLRGFRRRPAQRQIEWRHFVEFTGFPAPQPAMRFDTSIAGGLTTLPPSAVSATEARERSLPYRTLVKGFRLGLPSGQEVAAALEKSGNLSREQTDKLLRQVEMTGWRDRRRQPLPELARFSECTPLWYYILKEAEEQQGGLRLGLVGSWIVTETFIGLLRADSSSIWNTNWRPSEGSFDLADLFRYAPVS